MRFSRFAASCILLFCTVSAYARDTETLVVHHFLSVQSATHAKLLQPWKEALESQSNGRLTVQLFPSMTLGGKPPELYQQVRDGAVDAVWTLIGYTPGVFPRTEVFELPGIHTNSAEATTYAIQDTWELIKDDFKDIHVVLLHVHQGNVLHTAKTPIDTLADVRGLKLRTPSRTGGWLIESLGAEPVGMPLPNLPQSLAKGVVDGAFVPFEILPAIRLHELTDYSVTGEDSFRFGTAVFLFAMNKTRYESLAPELRAVIDANAGKAIAGWVSRMWEGEETNGAAVQTASGARISALNTTETNALRKHAESVVDRWIATVAKRGIDGQKIVDNARAAITAHSNRLR